MWLIKIWWIPCLLDPCQNLFRNSNRSFFCGFGYSMNFAMLENWNDLKVKLVCNFCCKFVNYWWLHLLSFYFDWRIHVNFDFDFFFFLVIMLAMFPLCSFSQIQWKEFLAVAIWFWAQKTAIGSSLIFLLMSEETL